MTMAPQFTRGRAAPGRGPQPRPQPRPQPQPHYQHHHGQDLLLAMGAHQIVKPLGLAPLEGSTTSPGLKLSWPRKGRVIGFTGFAIDPEGEVPIAEASARIQIQIQTDGGRNVISNGESGDFAALYGLTPASSPWFPLDLDVEVNSPWIVTFRNIGPSGGSLSPEVLFAFRREG